MVGVSNNSKFSIANSKGLTSPNASFNQQGATVTNQSASQWQQLNNAFLRRYFDQQFYAQLFNPQNIQAAGKAAGDFFSGLASLCKGGSSGTSCSDGSCDSNASGSSSGNCGETNDCADGSCEANWVEADAQTLDDATKAQETTDG